jgi:hypothetical protein
MRLDDSIAHPKETTFALRGIKRMFLYVGFY